MLKSFPNHLIRILGIAALVMGFQPIEANESVRNTSRFWDAKNSQNIKSTKTSENEWDWHNEITAIPAGSIIKLKMNEIIPENSKRFLLFAFSKKTEVHESLRWLVDGNLTHFQCGIEFKERTRKPIQLSDWSSFKIKSITRTAMAPIMFTARPFEDGSMIEIPNLRSQYDIEIDEAKTEIETPRERTLPGVRAIVCSSTPHITVDMEPWGATFTLRTFRKSKPELINSNPNSILNSITLSVSPHLIINSSEFVEGIRYAYGLLKLNIRSLKSQ